MPELRDDRETRDLRTTMTETAELDKDEWKQIAYAVTVVALLLAMRNFQVMLL